MGIRAVSVKGFKAIGRDGDRFLLVNARKYRGGKNTDAPAKVHDLESSQESMSDAKPLQVWFKFGVYEPCTEAEYQAAVSRVRESAG